jgi:hypothetical protein
MSALPSIAGTPNVGVQQILPADTTTAKTAFTAGASGSKLAALVATNTDAAAAYGVQVFLKRSATSYLLGTVNVPLSAGNTVAAPAVDLLGAVGMPGLAFDNDGQHYLPLMTGDTIMVASLTTVNAAKVLSFVASGGDL